MIEETQMESQTLEILRQGVWASITGGWFYDPRQDIFCNTFHLYIWLYLLCVPFCIYVYCPPSLTIWYFYSGSIILGLAVLKLINYGLHRMYDTKECIHEEVEDLKNFDEGIELQILPKSTGEVNCLGTKARPHHHEVEFGPLHSNDADSLEFDFHQLDYSERACKPTSTIDLKAEVHRKNSSESDDAPFVLIGEQPPSNNYKDVIESQKLKYSDHHVKDRCFKTDSCATFAKDDEESKLNQNRDHQCHKILLRQKSSFQNVESELGYSNFVHKESPEKPFSNFTSLNFIPFNIQEEITPSASNSHLMYHIKPNKIKSVPYSLNLSKCHQTTRTSTRMPLVSSKFQHTTKENTNSEDRLIEDNDNSNSSSTFDMQGIRTDFSNRDDASDKNLSFSNSSTEGVEKIEPSVKIEEGSLSKKMYLREKEPGMVARKKRIAYSRRRARRGKPKSHLQYRHEGNFSSLLELDLDWLFEDNCHRLQNREEPLTLDTEWSSTTTVSLEHEVNKVAQDSVPSTSSLGAIPKKIRISKRDHSTSIPRKLPKSEYATCNACGCKAFTKLDMNKCDIPLKENKVTQTQICCSEKMNPIEDLKYVMFSPHMAEGSKIEFLKISDYNKSNIHSKYEDGSSNGSNNELSTLLPPVSLLSAFLLPRSENINLGLENFTSNSNRVRLKRMPKVRRRRSMQTSKKEIFSESASAECGMCNVKKLNDSTNSSCSHRGLDEFGYVLSNEEEVVGTNTQCDGSGASNLSQPDLPLQKYSLRSRKSDTPNIYSSVIQRPTIDIWDSNESICISSASLQKSKHPINSSDTSEQLNRFKHTFEHDRLLVDVHGESKFKCIKSDSTDNNYKRTKTYYVFKLWPWTYIKVSTDRLKLLALLDRNLSFTETILSIIIGSLVGIFGAIMLYKGFYRDLLAFLLCFVIASCQYSLIKSVQPDAASPTHGFNRIIAYSRPIYFCLFSIIVIIMDSYVLKETKELRYTSSFNFSNQQLLLLSCDFIINFILVFPLLFSLGLFPQINTFLMYLLEQIDMHLFGGNAMSSLLASFYCIFRSCFATIILAAIAYCGLSESKGAQHISFSVFCASLVSASYHLSRSTSDPIYIWKMLKNYLWLPDVYKEQERKSQRSPTKKKYEEKSNVKEKSEKTNCKQDFAVQETKIKTVKFPDDQEKYPENDNADYLPSKLQKINKARIKHDIIICSLIGALVFSIHASTVFTVLQPELSPVLWSIAATLGFLLHYIVPQLRKQLPWLCIARPILRSLEHEQYQVKGPAKVMWFERIYVYFSFLERNILYPLLFLSVLTEDSPRIVTKYGTLRGSFIVVICGIKCLRSSYSNQSSQYLILVFSALCFKYDHRNMDETFLVIYFFMITVFNKMYELLLKIQFVVTYIAPWQITWGSAFHAFAQPFSVPHSAMLFLQALLTSCLSMPLNPFLGSVIFIMSYVRPIKFWERDYNTRRVDHSNTPLSSHLDRNFGADDNNLNSLFYEHLTRSLQHSLCGDLKMGRWGVVNQGDCFVLASDYLNCLVHIIEMGNDIMTFQMRGLEFRGTYCQQREVEAITEGVEENDGCCCCETGHLPNILSINAAFNQRWLAWEVLAAKYILEGYSISDNSAASMLQVFEFRKVLVSYYVKSIIFYLLRSSKLEEWLFNPTISKALSPMENKTFVDLDPIFNYNIDEDFDLTNSGITRTSFMNIHGDWIKYCVERCGKNIETGLNSPLILLCFALSLLGRRTLGAVSHNTVSGVEFFLYGLHALFKGDFRISCARDEWIFTDMDLLKCVVAPGIKMSLKLHQDHFMSPEEYEELPTLYDAICKHEDELVISHEGDPAWRQGVLSGAPSLLALRHVLDEGNDEYKIIMLNKRYLSFRVIKLNKECVRGLWAGQQQELVYFRNRNPERGSIQNAKQALRNIINSSCDQPIGYPIYVSPLTTSYAETNEQYASLVGGPVSLKKIKNYFFNTFRRVMRKTK